MEHDTEVKEAYSYLKSHFGSEFLESELGLEKKTLRNYEKGSFPKTLSRQAKSVIIAFRVSSVLSEFSDIEIKREFRTEIKPGETIKDVILRFSESPDLSLAIEHVESLIQRRIENLKSTSPIERFRSKYGSYNENNLALACRNNDADLLKQIILSSNLDARPKGYAIVALAENDPEKKHEEFINDFLLNDSPYLREAAIKAAFQYLNDEDEGEVEAFKKKMDSILKESSMFQGVKKTISDIVEML